MTAQAAEGIARYADVREEARDLIKQATAQGVTLRVTGGVAVALRCPSAARPPLRREYKDVDLVGPGHQRQEIDALMKGLGFTANEEFNSLHGHHQLLYVDSNSRVLDIFIDSIVMCHSLNVKDRLELHDLTLSPADLLLTKLQVIETSESDFKDAIAVLVDCEVERDRVASVLASDWGWWRTATEVLGKLRDYGASLEGFEGRARVADRIAQLEEQIEAAPKGLRWKARARIGDRVPWYQLPENAQ